jgi:hypothetical protein
MSSSLPSDQRAAQPGAVVTDPRTSLLPLAPVASVWGVAVGAIALAGGFVTERRVPFALVMAAVTPLVAFGIAWRGSPAFRRWVRGLDLRVLVAAQLWRVVGTTFLFLFAAGEVTGPFAWPAGVGDIATGLAALAVLSGLLRGSLTRRRLLAFTALGLGDFIVAFAVAGAISPDELVRFPLALFPAMAVPWFAVLHALALSHLPRLPIRL